MLGTVESVGPDGWGIVVADDGARFPFHVTAISDGSRAIAVGARVSFAVTPGRTGRWEATTLSAFTT